MRIVETGRLDTEAGLARLRQLVGDSKVVKFSECDLLVDGIWAFCDDGTFLASESEMREWDVAEVYE